MIGGLFAKVFQRVPSLLYRVSLMMKPQVVFVLGGPGAGKGTQCSKIVEVRLMARKKDNENNEFHVYAVIQIMFSTVLGWLWL